MALQITDDYGLVLAAAGAIGMMQLFIGSGVMDLRGKLFKNKDFLAKPEVQAIALAHQKAFRTDMSGLGYPDMGCGRYSQHLEYSQWVELNNAQRAHYNMIESSGPVLACMLAAGLRYPKVCGCLGFGFAASRLIYAKGYKTRKGADGRVGGAIGSTLCAMGLYLTALVAGVITFAYRSQ
ncbi:unnamed protein product [Polarella glacialis]|uniref:Glutathione transferase n=1 Tax=Polarella glacialis TaxID=89957 RepID=A0A813IAC2_POLGL|nr:unnamed protein product [Polarella glacialis]CAE8647420.1 unnamed protein product [Polarella glacialis]